MSGSAKKTHILRGNLGVGEAELIRFKLLFLKIPFCINVDSLKPTILFMKPPGDHFAFCVLHFATPTSFQGWLGAGASSALFHFFLEIVITTKNKIYFERVSGRMGPTKVNSVPSNLCIFCCTFPF